ncbi:MAG: NADPH-dependent oxidoreductase [Chitinophagaceae bacterium]|nr:MAG: NADPH-dependent oxidoreductase [Chitinophagaceae bacterium]
MHKIKIITSTTREGRKGVIIANWITELVKGMADVEAELLDLAEINLPLMDEPNHPKMKQYKHPHTLAWSRKIEEADGFIIVLAEYNYGFPAPIKNALDYLFQEWQHKPVGFVSYGGASGGLRSTQMLKQVVTTLSMIPLVEQVALSFFTKYINEQSRFVADATIEKAAGTMLSELHRWMTILRPMRGA